MASLLWLRFGVDFLSMPDPRLFVFLAYLNGIDLKPGKLAQVAGVFFLALNDQPKKQANPVGLARDTLVLVLEGPIPDAAEPINWWRVFARGRIGFASGKFLAGLDVEPHLEVTGTSNGLRLRAEASPQAATLGGIPENSVARWLAGPIEGGAYPTDGGESRLWCKVHWEGQDAWLAAGFTRPARRPTDPVIIADSNYETVPGIAIRPRITSAVGARSPEQYNRVIDQFFVDTNKRYRWTPGDTYCNIFMSDVTLGMNAPIPHRVRVGAAGQPTGSPFDFDANGKATGFDGGKELLCADTIPWLEAHGAAIGWRQVATIQEAERFANQGKPAIVLRSDHVAVIRPSSDGGISDNPEIAQAGAKNRSHIRFREIFDDRPRQFWVHD